MEELLCTLLAHRGAPASGVGLCADHVRLLRRARVLEAYRLLKRGHALDHRLHFLDEARELSLQVLERKYGDSLSNEDLLGFKPKKKRRRGVGSTTGMSQAVVPGIGLL